MAEELRYIHTRGVLGRLVLLVAVALSLIGAWFGIRWYLGNTIAGYLITEGSDLQAARLAVRLAPDDPYTHWRLAEVEGRTLEPDQIARAISENEKAVSLAPNDYRYWLALGRAFELAGDSIGAEQAMARAVQLAPSYAFPRWYLGNLLLRSGRDSEAFAELQLAAAANPALLNQVFNLAWQFYGPDFEVLLQAIGTSPQVRAQFSHYLIEKAEIDDGLRLWRTLDAEQKREHKAIGEQMVLSLIGSKRFRQALEVWNDLAHPKAVGEVGQFIDGGFEDGVQTTSGPFGWRMNSVPQLQINLDASQRHSGTHSLRILFRVRTRLEAVNLAQLVVVEPNSEYELEFYLKTEKLQTGGSPFIEIASTAPESVLASSRAAPTGDNDWLRVNLVFRTGAATEAIMVRVPRASCGEDPVCPIFGTLWYDDFKLKRRS